MKTKSVTKTPPEPRRRNAADTRAAILTSAREAFARAGYDGAGVREIAAGAGVTAMLVNRYFGSKEALFTEVLASIFGGPRVLTEDLVRSSDGARQLAEAVVEMTGPDATPLDGFLILLRSASNPRATQIGREQIEAHHQKAAAEALAGPDAAVRAGLILAVISGVQTLRQGVGLSTLTQADPGALTDRLETIFSLLIDGSRRVVV